MSKQLEAKITEPDDGMEVVEEQPEYRSISFDQQYVFDRLPLSREQKEKLIAVLTEEATKQKAG